MSWRGHSTPAARLGAAFAVMMLVLLAQVGAARASTYVVYLPLDSPVYEELDTLNGLGFLDTYLDEIKPISRIEAARLTLEAERNLHDSPSDDDELARHLIRMLRTELWEEIGWMEQNAEDDLPTMFHPVERLEAQYVYSRGQQRQWRTSAIGVPSDAGINAEEATPLLPNNDGLPTAAGSNEIARWSGWVGLGGFLTGYGEGALAGPFTRSIPGVSRLQPLGSAVVVSLGNVALSFGTEEMWWGPGHFGAMAQSNNASPFPALRLQNVHPTLLPWIFRYLGQFRVQTFFGQLDGDRYFAHPWIDGQIVSFKPLPNFEFGLTHAIDFGGRFNDRYSPLGFFGRATSFATGDPKAGNTHQRVSAYVKARFPSLRDAEIYGEILGEDFFQPFGHNVPIKMPFKAPSYQVGIYIPRLTRDGLTDARLEFTILDRKYSTHSDSLYWVYEGQLMGDPIGPNASEVDFQIGRWLDLSDKVDADIFYTQQAPSSWDDNPVFYPYPLGDERSAGVAFDLLRLARTASGPIGDGLSTIRARGAVEYTQGLNYESHANSVRFLVMFSGAFTPLWQSLEWR